MAAIEKRETGRGLAPTSEIDRVRREFDRLFEAMTGTEMPFAVESTFVPIDVVENPEQLVLMAELPGVSANDVKVTVDGNLLTISGEKKWERDEKRDNYLRVERSYGTFTRSFTLPAYVESNQVAADYRDGVLTLRMPKRAEKRARQIEIKSGTGR